MPFLTNMSSNQPILTITLRVINTNDAFPTRVLTLKAPDYLAAIGRCSKNAEQSLLPARNTAWFDSRVMSRQHAIVQADPHSKTVTIQDTGSMHGIWHDGKQIPDGVDHNVVDGDVITFGVNVERGIDSFQAISLMFEYDWAHDAREIVDLVSPAISPINTPSRTYAVPDGSDYDEEFDGEDARSLEEFAQRPEGAEEMLLQSSQTFAVPGSDQSDGISIASNEDDDGNDHTNTSPSLSGPAEPEETVEDPKSAQLSDVDRPALPPRLAQSPYPNYSPYPKHNTEKSQEMAPSLPSRQLEVSLDFASREEESHNGFSSFQVLPPSHRFSSIYGDSDKGKESDQLGASYYNFTDPAIPPPIPQCMWSPYADRPPYPTYPEPTPSTEPPWSIQQPHLLGSYPPPPLPPTTLPPFASVFNNPQPLRPYSPRSRAPYDSTQDHPSKIQTLVPEYAERQPQNVRFDVPESKPKQGLNRPTPVAEKQSLKRKAASISSMVVEVPETTVDKATTTTTEVEPEPVQTQSEILAGIMEPIPQPPQKRVRVEEEIIIHSEPTLRQSKSTSNLSTIAATAMTGVVVGAVGTLFGLASLPQSYFT